MAVIALRVLCNEGRTNSTPTGVLIMNVRGTLGRLGTAVRIYVIVMFVQLEKKTNSMSY